MEIRIVDFVNTVAIDDIVALKDGAVTPEILKHFRDRIAQLESVLFEEREECRRLDSENRRNASGSVAGRLRHRALALQLLELRRKHLRDVLAWLTARAEIAADLS